MGTISVRFRGAKKRHTVIILTVAAFSSIGYIGSRLSNLSKYARSRIPRNEAKMKMRLLIKCACFCVVALGAVSAFASQNLSGTYVGHDSSGNTCTLKMWASSMNNPAIPYEANISLTKMGFDLRSPEYARDLPKNVFSGETIGTGGNQQNLNVYINASGKPGMAELVYGTWVRQHAVCYFSDCFRVHNFVWEDTASGNICWNMSKHRRASNPSKCALPLAQHENSPAELYRTYCGK